MCHTRAHWAQDIVRWRMLLVIHQRHLLRLCSWRVHVEQDELSAAFNALQAAQGGLALSKLLLIVTEVR